MEYKKKLENLRYSYESNRLNLPYTHTHNWWKFFEEKKISIFFFVVGRAELTKKQEFFFH